MSMALRVRFKSSARVSIVVAAVWLVACAITDTSTFSPANVADGGSSGSAVEGGGFSTTDAGNEAVTVIYAHTDNELYELDPTTKKVTLVGPFQAEGTLGSVTDLAVTKNDEIWVNTTRAIYRVSSLPKAGDPVHLDHVADFPGDINVYALAFTPEGALEAGESLIAGDGDGAIHVIDQKTGSARKLGGFGDVRSGDPAPKDARVWTLSGDLVFYKVGNAVKGLATLRACGVDRNANPIKCDTTNDVLAEVDMVALRDAFTSKKYRNLRKQILGGGTRVGRLYGMGAWGDRVYAFARAQTDPQAVAAQLIEVSGSGTGTPLEAFPDISYGWSGAGVTTRAKIDIIR